jgi:glyoxylase-like metal-dependent hydrolase (beta-lactamase superfamily II)
MIFHHRARILEQIEQNLTASIIIGAQRERFNRGGPPGLSCLAFSQQAGRIIRPRSRRGTIINGMDFTPFDFVEVAPGILVYRGAVNTGVLKCGERAILIDCDDSLTPARLQSVGINTVERIYCTQHRRPNTAGAAAFAVPVFVPRGERSQFEGAGAYWQDWRNRWHLYHFRPGPLAPLWDIPLAGVVGEGDVIEWGGFCVSVLDTPGMTDGAVSYSVERCGSGGSNNRVIFSGDVLYAAGQVWDVHSLQKNNGAYSDYHGFLGAARELSASLEKLSQAHAACLIPSHGSPISDPPSAAQLAILRLEQLNRNYTALSAINFYFPHIFHDLRDDPQRMTPAALIDFPDFIRPVAFTSFAVLSESGGLFLIDCGHDSVLETLDTWQEAGVYQRLEACWVTHYHDDHVDSLHRLASSTGVPIYADEHLAEVIAHPSRFLLPCISPAAAPVHHVTACGETWRWHEFEFTALHFPGQAYYHGGLLMRGRGLTVLFCGDSFAPAGLDDYCAGNRNFLGAGKGYRRCIDLLRQHQPDLILNQHQQKAFRFSHAQLDYMQQMLVEREAMLAELLPWPHPNYGTDSGWIRAYPYEVETSPGAACTLEVRATNHAEAQPALSVEAIMPPGWESAAAAASFVIEDKGESITCARVSICPPPHAQQGTYPVALRVTWGGRCLGQICHTLVKVR